MLKGSDRPEGLSEEGLGIFMMLFVVLPFSYECYCMRLRSWAEYKWPNHLMSERARLNKLTLAELAEEAQKAHVDREDIDRAYEGMDPRVDLIREIIQSSPVSEQSDGVEPDRTPNAVADNFQPDVDEEQILGGDGSAELARQNSSEWARQLLKDGRSGRVRK